MALTRRTVIGVPDESPTVRRGLRVDDHSHHVDGDMMVVPAEGDQIVGIVVATVGALSYVMWLQPVTTGT